jgi:sigma-B regulation protein RsbU (phosphoserine phosphatase)
MKITRLEQKLQLKDFKLSWIKDISTAINENLETEALLDLFLDFLKEKLDVTQIMFFSAASKNWELLGCSGISGSPKMKSFESYNEIKDIRVGEFKIDGVKEAFEIVIPVYHHGKLLSLLFLADPEEKIGISPIIKHMNFIQTLANLISVAIVNKRLHKEEIEKERLNREMELAADMQNSLIPDNDYESKRLNLNAHYHPHHLIGGDYYDYFVDESRIVFCMADVSGKGISAAIFMSNFQAKLHALLKNTDLRLAELIDKLHQDIDEISGGDRFITFFIGEYNFDTRLMEYVNAGHNPPLLMKEGEISELRKGTTGLGMVRTLPTVNVGSVVLKRGDMILCYTDGITETINKDGEWYGEERLQKVFRDHCSEDAASCNVAILNSISQFKGEMEDHDDFALLTLYFN